MANLRNKLINRGLLKALRLNIFGTCIVSAVQMSGFAGTL